MNSSLASKKSLCNQGDFDLLVFLPLSPVHWDDKWMALYLVYEPLRIQSVTLCMPGKTAPVLLSESKSHCVDQVILELMAVLWPQSPKWEPPHLI